MTNIHPDSATIAHFAMRLQYDDITDAASMIDFANSYPALTSTTLRAKLIDMIDLDLNDMLHNANFDFYLPIAELDALTDDELDELADHLLDHIDPAMIADLMLSTILR